MTAIVKKTSGVTVKEVSRKSPFFTGGLRGGDRITAINGNRLFSELDFQYFSAEQYLQLEVERSNIHLIIEVERSEGEFCGVTLAEAPINRCANRCIFCFIDQMPSGLRKSLYIKDEDIRLSLLNGNYVTMSNFKQQDLDAIVRIGLSPLYISVHATDLQVRRCMLGNRKAPDILQQLAFLAGHGIRFHTQIVVCPSFNDGDTLKKTVSDLLAFGEALSSVAVVPVGLTRFGNPALLPVSRKIAYSTCSMISALSDKAAKRDGFRKIFLADEFFIKAGLPIPDNVYYEDYPQIENGVGLVRQLLDSCMSAEKSVAGRKRNIRQKTGKRLLITSVSAEPYIREIVEKIFTCKGTITILPVINTYFGETVTVAGLLTASDIIRSVKRECGCNVFDEVIIPGIVFNYAGHTLDGFSAARISKAVGSPVRVIQTITELLK